jgi:hypothetical protein
VRHAAAAAKESAMGVPWRIELNPDVTMMTDGTSCVIGGVVSVSFELHEVEFVWSEGSPRPH